MEFISTIFFGLVVFVVVVAFLAMAHEISEK